MKGVILAGGSGTRLKPFTNVINKHLLPVGKWPMICWPILKLKEAGIEDMLIVTNEKDLPHFFKMIGNGKNDDVTIRYAVQDGPFGIADAIKKAKDFTKDDPFIVLLGDNIFEMNLRSYLQPFVKSGKDVQLFLKEVKDPERYGIAFLNREKNRIVDLVEKPSSGRSNLCITGIYLYKPSIYEILDEISPSPRGEYEITEANKYFLKKGTIGFTFVKGFWIDAGTHESLLDANVFIYNLMNGKVEKDAAESFGHPDKL